MHTSHRILRLLAIVFLAFSSGKNVLAQTIRIGFDGSDVAAIGVYDTWEQSPFRTGVLEGHTAIVTSTDSLLTATFGNGESVNILAVQRSRFGSNTFGARIDLAKPFALPTKARYVHVPLWTPKEGRAMLVGLGKRTERKGQSEETEQFWVRPSNTISAGKWNDAVFAINGASGIEIYSLVVVPDNESTHDLDADFAAFVGPITINDSPAPILRYEDYPINISPTAVSAKSSYYVNSISLSSPADGLQSIDVGSMSPLYVWRDKTSERFYAHVGETVKPSISYRGNWMNCYVYLDLNRNGAFDVALTEKCTPEEGNEMLSYAYIETVENTSGFGMDGSAISGNSRNTMSTPAFTIPKDLEPGIYRMRFKVDWGNSDPGGRVTSSNHIVSNGGSIVDVLINIHGDWCNVREANRNGDVTAPDGSSLSGISVPFHQALTVVPRPENGFYCAGLRIRHGYNLSGSATIHSVPQYEETIVPAYLFQDGTFTIPAELMDGDVEIEGLFTEKKGDDINPDEDYVLDFPIDETLPDDANRLTRLVSTATQGGKTTLTLPSSDSHRYIDLLTRQMSVVPGDDVSLTATFSQAATPWQLLIDFNQDGQFLKESISESYIGEIVTRSEGSDATFAVPALLPTGCYRARFESETTVCDFLLNVHNPTHPLTLLTTTAASTAAPMPRCLLNCPASRLSPSNP